jgi:hypothetical protein
MFLEAIGRIGALPTWKGEKFMQMLALLWFELQFAQQYFGEVFWRSKVAAKTRDSTSASSVAPNSLNRVGINCCAPVEPVQLPPLRLHSRRQIPREAAHMGASNVKPVEVRNLAQTSAPSQ